MEVRMPFEIFRDTDGSPLDAGYIYIGAENQDPIANPVQVFWNAALTIQVAQPIRTLGGYPARSGAPGKLFTASNYSITVKNAKGVLISSVLSAGGTTEIDLASTASTTKGSGMVGHDDTKVYAARHGRCVPEPVQGHHQRPVGSSQGRLRLRPRLRRGYGGMGHQGRDGPMHRPGGAVEGRAGGDDRLQGLLQWVVGGHLHVL